MKPKNIVFIAQSLDGYISDKKGGIDWLHSTPNPENDDLGYLDLMNEIDAIVMGRNTFDVVCGFEGEWPYSKHLFVLSHSLNKVPKKCEGKVTILNGNVTAILEQIHNKGFLNLYIDGGQTIHNFLEADKIDELRMTTIPILLGGGVSLFNEMSIAMEFDHLSTTVYINQLVQSHYRRKR
ncbi:MAG: dihydrofolate reductase [Saprospiraceae bacterium]|nr:dihydrofolate reductase family protein [Bacteroidia bacterium]NNE14902.1 dihydrofolate reductase [Saprospiraceae bacterium]NNL91843.1 dihydrofolate reductase [Saprospiraceae bacterium]